MRVWDVSPGYLNRQSLLGEHRELHGLHSILVHGKTGYSRHPETVRWVGCLSGLSRRHATLAAEMRLRGYVDRTPLREAPGRAKWPARFVTEPHLQFESLRAKYRTRDPGRIPLPRSARELWEQHETSVLARDGATHRALRRRAAAATGLDDLASISAELIRVLRQPPSRRGLERALERMWRLVATSASPAERRSAESSPARLLATTQRLALRTGEPALIRTTALGELATFVDATRRNLP